jgi:hypothetical protein
MHPWPHAGVGRGRASFPTKYVTRVPQTKTSVSGGGKKYVKSLHNRAVGNASLNWQRLDEHTHTPRLLWKWILPSLGSSLGVSEEMLVPVGTKGKERKAWRGVAMLHGRGGRVGVFLIGLQMPRKIRFHSPPPRPAPGLLRPRDPTRCILTCLWLSKIRGKATAGSLSNLEEHPLDSGLPQVGRCTPITLSLLLSLLLKWSRRERRRRRGDGGDLVCLQF